MDILFRLGVALLIIGIGIALYFLITRLRLSLLRHASRDRVDAGLEGFRAGVPAILYFTTPDCVPCRTVQGPAIEELLAQYGDRLQVIKVDAAERTDLANQWGVLSVPTTFIIDAQGQPRHVNNGVATAPKLRQQLRDFAGLGEPPKNSNVQIRAVRETRFLG
ncbi:MAG: thioredoxin family protein [Chloroflexi bacterium]|nr:thioredoxin family protein [Chloroflexota bacterium]